MRCCSGLPSGSSIASSINWLMRRSMNVQSKRSGITFFQICVPYPIGTSERDFSQIHYYLTAGGKKRPLPWVWKGPKAGMSASPTGGEKLAQPDYPNQDQKSRECSVKMRRNVLKPSVPRHGLWS